MTSLKNTIGQSYSILVAVGRSLLFFFSILICVSFQPTVKGDYFSVVAKKGDGIYSLLRKYNLMENTCNLNQFLIANNLKPNAPLLIGKEYYLPILIYKYNGKSIRSSIGNNDLDKAKRIQAFNELMLRNNFRKKSYKTSNILWVPFHELNCKKEAPKVIVKEEEMADKKTGDEKTGTRNFPIFGKKFAHTPLKSNTLKGKIFYVEGGHGGPDPGAIGKVGVRKICEDEYAYDVSLRIARLLITHGATVYVINRDPDDGIRTTEFLTCDCDEVTYPKLKVPRAHKPRLFQRSDAINKLYAANAKAGSKNQYSVVVHVDSRGKSQSTDTFFYYKKWSKDGEKLATSIRKTMASKYKHKTYKGTISSRDLHMLRETKPTMVYIELGNIRNSSDQKRLLVESNRQALANWIYEGIAKAVK
jgi:N-acetylmuramoyl-L-alanine amidase